MPRSDQVKDSGEHPEQKGDQSNHDGKTERGENDKVGPDGKTEGERISDQAIRDEQELRTPNLPPPGGGGDGGAAPPNPPPGVDEKLLSLPPAAPAQRHEIPEISAGGGVEGAGHADPEVDGRVKHRGPRDGGARDVSLPDVHSSGGGRSRAAALARSEAEKVADISRSESEKAGDSARAASEAMINEMLNNSRLRR